MIETQGAPKVIVRVRGGLGNQLFCYAAARRLAVVNNVELVIDDETGFTRDYFYGRRYMLDRFNILARKATPSEKMEPFERWRRGLKKMISRRRKFESRRYIEQEGLDFDKRLLTLKVSDLLYLDGYWQSEGYFKDIEDTIREDLLIRPPEDVMNQRMAEKIHNSRAVALHVRWFDAPGCRTTCNISTDYYRRAIVLMEERVESPHYFVFSDDSAAAVAQYDLSGSQVTLVSHNRGDENAYADLWLMAQCQHFIIANSTFSWWGAWLAEEKEKCVVTPDLVVDGKTCWGFKGLVPTRWMRI